MKTFANLCKMACLPAGLALILWVAPQGVQSETTVFNALTIGSNMGVRTIKLDVSGNWLGQMTPTSCKVTYFGQTIYSSGNTKLDTHHISFDDAQGRDSALVIEVNGGKVDLHAFKTIAVPAGIGDMTLASVSMRLDKDGMASATEK